MTKLPEPVLFPLKRPNDPLQREREKGESSERDTTQRISTPSTKFVRVPVVSTVTCPSLDFYRAMPQGGFRAPLTTDRWWLLMSSGSPTNQSSTT